MKIATFVFILLMAVGSVATAEHHTNSAKDWYLNDYSVLWKTNDWEKLQAVGSYYAPQLKHHTASGEITTLDSKKWLAESVAGWVEDGWLSSTVAALEADELNETTVIFKSKWHDIYQGDQEEYSCLWYLADRHDDDWIFTAIADLDCEAHGL